MIKASENVSPRKNTISFQRLAVDHDNILFADDDIGRK